MHRLLISAIAIMFGRLFTLPSQAIASSSIFEQIATKLPSSICLTPYDVVLNHYAKTLSVTAIGYRIKLRNERLTLIDQWLERN
jgi:hypothetical protein